MASTVSTTGGFSKRTYSGVECLKTGAVCFASSSRRNSSSRISSQTSCKMMPSTEPQSSASDAPGNRRSPAHIVAYIRIPCMMLHEFHSRQRRLPACSMSIRGFEENPGAGMATKYRVIKIKGAERESFMVVGIDFDEHNIKS